MSILTFRAKSRPQKPERQPMDKLLFLLTLALLGVGIVTVFDASYALALEHRNGDSFFYVKLQAAWAAVGLGALLLARQIPFWFWRKWAWFLVTISVILLAAVMVPHIGIRVGGARRWVGHGPIRIQPSELAKLALVIYLAHVTVKHRRDMVNFQLGLLPPLLVIGLLAALVAIEPDLGTAMVLGGTGITLLFLAGGRPRHLLGVVGAAACAVALYAVSSHYRMQRLTSFVNIYDTRMKEGYQVWHSLIALGSGGVTGLGLGEGREKLYLPMARTDFIFPVIAEEWGLIGTLTLITIFLLLAMRGFVIAYRTKDPFGMLLAAGITTLISVQALVNMAVATSSIPNTGVPLPFISYGGSSLVLLMAGIGILLNISSFPNGENISDGGNGRGGPPLAPPPSPPGRGQDWDRDPPLDLELEPYLRRLERAKQRELTPTGSNVPQASRLTGNVPLHRVAATRREE